MFGKVLILSASAGAGHLRAAEALEKAFIEKKAAREVRHIDTLQYTNKVFRDLYSKAYIDMVNKAPEVLGWLYDALDQPWKMQRRRLAFDKLNTVPFVNMLKEEQPDILVCTHFLPAEIISWLKGKHKIEAPQAIVVTDFDVHAMWLCKHCEYYFVAIDETRIHLQKLGIPGDRIRVSGIPIDPVFSTPKGKREMRAKHGLRQDVVTILISAGGFGVGPMENLIQSLTELSIPAQIVAICGRSEPLRRKVEKAGAALPRAHPVSLKVVGFTREMDEYMEASDLLLGKPGGLTTSEALAKGLVFVIVNPIPGQEERNSDHLLEEGAAIRCNNLPALAYKIEKLLADPGRLKAMSESSRQMSHPQAAFDIVEQLLELNR